MKSTLTIKVASMVFIIMSAANVIAQTIDTNIPGLVVKDLKCETYDNTMLSAKIINRNLVPFAGVFRIRVIDKDSDIIWQGTQKFQVEAQNGLEVQQKIWVGNCLAPNKIQFTLER